MQYSPIGLKQLTEAFEECRLVAYQDVKGVWTIGYGHIYNVHEGMVCTQEQAECWLLSDVAMAVAAVNRLVDLQLTQGEFDALVDFTFNVGVGAFSNSTLLTKLNTGDILGASQEFARWDYAGGVVIQGLVRRRLAEAKVFDNA